MIRSSQHKQHLLREAEHWGSVRPDPSNPQLWHDHRLYQLFFGKEYSLFLERAIQHGPDILELGCGEGSLAIQLAQRGMRVTAIDLSKERISRGRAMARKAGVEKSLHFKMADLNTFKPPRNRYTCVIAHDSLHHILALGHLLDNVQTALKNDGVLLVMDYVGMGRIRKLFAAGLFAILPTVQPYREKWRLRKRFRAFMASEKQKRSSLGNQDSPFLHPDSPFEEISQGSIIREIEKRFSVERFLSFLPFWFYLAPKVRVPSPMRFAVGRVFRALDEGTRTLGVRGAYCLIEARKKRNHGSTSH